LHDAAPARVICGIATAAANPESPETMTDSPPRSLTLDAFRAHAEANGLRMPEAELVEVHAAHGVLAALLARLDATPIAEGDDWPASVVEAWER
jgi:hypothetical protein